MRNKTWAGCLELLVLGLLGVLGGFPTGAAEGTAGEVKPAYTVVPTKKPPVIDGKLDDE